MQFSTNPRSLFRRCVQCPEQVPKCPPCAIDEPCLLLSKSCDACPSAKCSKKGTLPGQSNQNGPSQTPAIAGGVAGAVLFIVIATFAVWWFCIRKRRQEWDDQDLTERDDETLGVEKRDQAGLNRSARNSTRSMRSIASSVRTQASNVIPIAYIPGVTNRSPNESPSMMVPPVPPVPAASAQSSPAPSPHHEQDRHFFMPNDLRGSTYSDASARQSLSPSLARTSLATALWRGHAEASPTAAQQALRGKAAVVTLNKNSGHNSPAELPTPDGLQKKGPLSSSIVARNLTPKPVQVKKADPVKKSKVPTMANLQTAKRQSSLQPQDEPTPDRSEDDETDANTRLISSSSRPQHESAAVTVIDDTPAIKQSQFTDVSSSSSSTSSFGFSPVARSAAAASTSQRSSPSISQRSRQSASQQGGSSLRHNTSGSLSSLIEDAMSRAARAPSRGLTSISELHGQSSTRRPSQSPPSDNEPRDRGDSVSGPFSDANEQEPPSRFSTWSPS